MDGIKTQREATDAMEVEENGQSEPRRDEFEASSLKDMRLIPRFNEAYRLATTWDKRTALTQVITKSAPPVIQKFGENRGLYTLMNHLRRAPGDYLSGGRDFVNVVLDVLNNVTLEDERFQKMRVDQVFKDLEVRIQNLNARSEDDERISKKLFKLKTKWKALFEAAAALPPGQRPLEEDDRPSMAPRKRFRSDSQDERYVNYAGRPRRTYKQPTQERQPRIFWKDDESLCTFKFYRGSDETTAPGLTKEEVAEIQKRLAEEEKSKPTPTGEELKHRESQWEGDALKSKKEKAQLIQKRLNEMSESIRWEAPRRMFLQAGQEWVKVSNEAQLQEERISKKLGCLYAREAQIPECPGMDNLANLSDQTREVVAIPLKDQEGERLRDSRGNHSARAAVVREAAQPIRIETLIEKPTKQREERVLKSILRTGPRKPKEVEKPEGPNAELGKLMELMMKAISLKDEETKKGMMLDIDKQVKLLGITTEQFKDMVQRVNLIKSLQAAQQTPQQSRAPPSQASTASQSPAVYPKPTIAPPAGIRPPMNGMHGQPGRAMDQQQFVRPQRNYRTQPCRMFLSVGCNRGDSCHFIHDHRSQGQPPPFESGRPPNGERMGFYNNSNPERSRVNPGFGGEHFVFRPQPDNVGRFFSSNPPPPSFESPSAAQANVFHNAILPSFQPPSLEAPTFTPVSNFFQQSQTPNKSNQNQSSNGEQVDRGAAVNQPTGSGFQYSTLNSFQRPPPNQMLSGGGWYQPPGFK